MKKVIVFIIILININSCTQTFNPSQLIGTKWERVESFSDPTIKWEFSKEEIHETVNRKIINKTVHFSNKYYFSQTIPTKFDWNKVGKGDKGKYLVYYVKKSKRFFYRRIETFSKDTLLFWHERDPEAIGGHSSYELYRRIE
jgi:hypothetical protein